MDLSCFSLTCEDKDERESRKTLRGCPYSPMCSGCELCVCFGCPECRFMGCNCRTCVDFYQNARGSRDTSTSFASMIYSKEAGDGGVPNLNFFCTSCFFLYISHVDSCQFRETLFVFFFFYN